MSNIIGAETAKLAGLQIDALQKVRTGQLTLTHFEWFLNLSTERREEYMVNGKPTTQAPVPAARPASILRLISGGETLVLDPTDGKETIPAAEDVFTGFIDSDFKNWGADEAGGPTPETSVQVHEMMQDATFAQMFGLMGVDKERLCLTHGQIKQFCQKHRNWLRIDGYATFFLFKSKGKFFVANVSFVVGGRLPALVHRFGYDGVWYGAHRPRVVVPQL